jgi:N-acetylglucosaminyldiphosphoundecaprenol N-acetyl-beta-D-mannosaminyltransferase
MTKGEPTLRTVRLFGIDMHAVTQTDAVDVILGWIEKRDGTLRFVVTPNVQHAVLFQENAALRHAYGAASLVIVDGAPIVWSSRLFGRPLPERVAGSDIVPALFSRATKDKPLSAYLLGGAAGVGERAGRAIARDFPHVRVVGIDSPPLGFERDEALDRGVVERIRQARPDLLLVGLGCPKQELWIERHQRDLEVPAALCIGGTIDFLAGEQPRAPQWMRVTGIEWVHRMASDPKRLAPRYASNAVDFPKLLYRQWRASRGARE